jgi:hypothetical protein
MSSSNDMQNPLPALLLGLSLIALGAWLLIEGDGSRVCGRGGCASTTGIALTAISLGGVYAFLGFRIIWIFIFPNRAPLSKSTHKKSLRRSIRVERDLEKRRVPAEHVPPALPYGPPAQYEELLRRTGAPEEQIQLALSNYPKT